MDILEVLRDMGIGAGRRLKGDAAAGDIRAGKTALNASGDVTGSLVVRDGAGATSITPSTTNQTLNAGIYDNNISIAGDADLVSANIRAGVNLFGVAGNANVINTLEATNPITAALVYPGKKGFVNGALVTGTMATKATASYTPGTANQTIAASQYLTGAQTILGDADLIGANIRAGVNIFGVAGNSNVINTTQLSFPIASDKIIEGHTGFVNGVEVTGGIPDLTGWQVPTNIVADGSIGRVYAPAPEGYFPGGPDSGLVLDDPDFIAPNFIATKTIFGLQGSIPVKNTDGNGYNNMNAKIANVWANGAGSLCFPIISGAYLDNASQAGLERDTPMGYIDDPDFIASNILATKNIFGLQGSIPVIPADAGDSFLARRSAAVTVGNFYGTGNVAMLAIDAYSYVGAVNWVRVPAPDLLAGNIKVGKTILGVAGTNSDIAGAKGTVTPTTNGNTRNFRSGYGGTNYYMPYVVVSGLTFKPRYIIVKPAMNNAWDQLANATIYTANRQAPGYDTIMCMGRHFDDTDLAAAANPPYWGYVTATEFCLPVRDNNGEFPTMEWIAIP